MWLNRDEIDMYAYRHRHAPVVGRAAQILRKFRDLVDANSDGWPYWKAASRAAKKLMILVHRGNATEAELTAALAPIKALCTRKKFEMPTA